MSRRPNLSYQRQMKMTIVDKSGEIYTIHIAVLLVRQKKKMLPLSCCCTCLTLECDITSGVCLFECGCGTAHAAPHTQHTPGLAFGRWGNGRDTSGDKKKTQTSQQKSAVLRARLHCNITSGGGGGGRPIKNNSVWQTRVTFQLSSTQQAPPTSPACIAPKSPAPPPLLPPPSSFFINRTQHSWFTSSPRALSLLFFRSWFLDNLPGLSWQRKYEPSSLLGQGLRRLAKTSQASGGDFKCVCFYFFSIIVQLHAALHHGLVQDTAAD